VAAGNRGPGGAGQRIGAPDGGAKVKRGNRQGTRQHEQSLKIKDN
jgi:hypothetical protein